MKEINVTVYGFVSFPFFHIRDRFEKLKKDNVRRKVEPVNLLILITKMIVIEGQIVG